MRFWSRSKADAHCRRAEREWLLSILEDSAKLCAALPPPDSAPVTRLEIQSRPHEPDDGNLPLAATGFSAWDTA